MFLTPTWGPPERLFFSPVEFSFTSPLLIGGGGTSTAAGRASNRLIYSILFEKKELHILLGQGGGRISLKDPEEKGETLHQHYIS